MPGIDKCSNSCGIMALGRGWRIRACRNVLQQSRAAASSSQLSEAMHEHQQLRDWMVAQESTKGRAHHSLQQIAVFELLQLHLLSVSIAQHVQLQTGLMGP